MSIRIIVERRLDVFPTIRAFKPMPIDALHSDRRDVLLIAIDTYQYLTSARTNADCINDQYQLIQGINVQVFK